MYGGNNRDDKWTKSIAVGSKGFVEEVRLLLGAMAKRRRGLKAAETFNKDFLKGILKFRELSKNRCRQG